MFFFGGKLLAIKKNEEVEKSDMHDTNTMIEARSESRIAEHVLWVAVLETYVRDFERKIINQETTGSLLMELNGEGMKQLCDVCEIHYDSFRKWIHSKRV